MINKSFLKQKFLKNLSSKNIIKLERGVDKKNFSQKKKLKKDFLKNII